MTLSINYLV